jgi:hypothetical protein
MEKRNFDARKIGSYTQEVAVLTEQKQKEILRLEKLKTIKNVLGARKNKNRRGAGGDSPPDSGKPRSNFVSVVECFSCLYSPCAGLFPFAAMHFRHWRLIFAHPKKSAARIFGTECDSKAPAQQRQNHFGAQFDACLRQSNSRPTMGDTMSERTVWKQPSLSVLENPILVRRHPIAILDADNDACLGIMFQWTAVA